MKIAWAAMAVATMLAIAALLWDLFGRPTAPALAATGPWPTSLCDRAPTGARGTGRPLPGYRLYFEGMSKLVGGCHPADPGSGVALVEQAFARGLPGAFAVSFADALIAQGQEEAAARWSTIAAIATIDWRGHGFDAFGVPLATTSRLRAEIARLRAVFGRADPADLVAEIETALERGGDPFLRQTIVDVGLIGRLFLVDPAAANYWRYRARRLDGNSPVEFGVLHPNLSIAQLCGYLPAIAEAIRLYLDAESDPGSTHIVIDSLLLSRDRGADVADLIAQTAEKFGEDIELYDKPEIRSEYAAWAKTACADSIAQQRRHFEVPPRWSSR